MRVSAFPTCFHVAPPSSDRYTPEPFSIALPTTKMR
jgi:hypothetical protein